VVKRKDMFKMDENGKKKLREVIDDVKTCMFTTTDEDCNVFSRPMLTIKVDNDLNLWFFSNEDPDKLDELSMHKQATLVYSHPGKNMYMNIYGSCTVIRDKEKMKEFWTPALKSWFQGGFDDPALCLVQVSVDEAVYWDNASNEMIPLMKAGSSNAFESAEAAEGFIPHTSNW
jgi:general stress protein 26